MGFTAVAASTKVLLGSFTVAGASETMRRTRGLVQWTTNQILASEFSIGAFGMCVVTEDAFAAGVASIPGPFTDAGSDVWFVHQFMMHSFQFASGVGIEGQFGNQYEIDSSAMRKVSEEQRVVLVVENGSANGAVFAFGIRLLASASRG